MRVYIFFLRDFIFRLEFIITNYDRVEEQYKHYSHSSAALMLNLPLNFGSYVIFRDRISSTKRRQKERRGTEATRAMRRELNPVSEEPKNIGILICFWETAHLALP